MKIFYKITFILISLVLLNACSGSDSSSATTTTSTSATVATLANLTATVSENAKEGDFVGTLSITSTGDSAITAITLSGTGSTNFLVSTDGAITLNSDSTLDYETTTSYNLTAIATNSVGNSASVNVDILVTDVATNPFEIAKIQASDAQANDQFGLSVSVSGDYIVVGAAGEDTIASAAGAAYLYKKDLDGSLSQIAKMQASDAEQDDYFGKSVSISGDYIVVGANGEDTTDGNASNAGAAYIFKRNSDSDVTQIAKIQASDAEGADYFGKSVSISGDYIVVGADSEDTNATNAGSAYVFKRNSDTTNDVTEIAKIQASDAQSDDFFGTSVSISGDYIVVGADGEDTAAAAGAGAAYVFKRNSDTTNDVTEIAKIQASDAGAGDAFGYSVSISGDYIVVGAHNDSRDETDAGSAYVFKRNSDSNVSEIAKLQAIDFEAEDYFGESVSISGDYIVVGANLEDINTSVDDDAGATYIFKRNSDSDVTQIAKIQASDADQSDEFGISVAISGDNIVVGAHQEGINAGSAYVFDLEASGPYIYNRPSSAISYDENILDNNVFSFDGVSTIGGVITYTVDGTDGSNFFFTDNNLFYISNADFEVPSDSDVLNDYNISITATDENNNAITLDMDIEVKDKYYLDLAKIQASDAEANDYFGKSVSIDGDYVVVGAYAEDTTDGNASAAGAAYLYKKETDGTLTQIAKMQASDAQTFDYFGISVSISGDYIVVGAYGEDTTASPAGSAYVFKRNSDTDVTEIAKIQASDAEKDDYFGWSVSISGDYIVVGAYGEDTTDGNVSGAGAAYIFKRNSDSNVSEIAKIQASDPGLIAKFGYSVAISGDYIAVGAYADDTNATDTGSAYIFKRHSDGNITELAKLQASDAGGSDFLGNAISIDGDYIVVGASEKETSATNAGGIYVFKRYLDTDIREIANIEASDGQVGDYFGNSVAISGDTIVVGAPFVSNSGATYVFTRNSDTVNDVTQITKIQSNDIEVSDDFGYSVSISGDNIVVGAEGEGTTATGAGSAYIFTKDPNQGQ